MGVANVDYVDLAPAVHHRSVSQLSTYSQCSEAFRLQKVAKAPQRPAAWFGHGSAFHSAIEEYELSGRAMTIEQAQEHYRADYDRRINEEQERVPEPEKWLTGGRTKAETDVENRRQRGADQVKIYIEYAEAHADQWRIWPVGDRGYAVELQFEVDFGGVNVLGYIDQVREYADGSIIPVDLKSGTKEPASALQLATYAHVINEFMGVLPTSGTFWMPKLRRDGTLVGDVWKDLTAWTKPLLDKMYRGFDAAERAGIYLPQPGDMCRVCTVQDACTVMGIPGIREQYADTSS